MRLCRVSIFPVESNPCNLGPRLILVLGYEYFNNENMRASQSRGGDLCLSLHRVFSILMMVSSAFLIYRIKHDMGHAKNIFIIRTVYKCLWRRLDVIFQHQELWSPLPCHQYNNTISQLSMSYSFWEACGIKMVLIKSTFIAQLGRWWLANMGPSDLLRCFANQVGPS